MGRFSIFQLIVLAFRLYYVSVHSVLCCPLVGKTQFRVEFLFGDNALLIRSIMTWVCASRKLRTMKNFPLKPQTSCLIISVLSQHVFTWHPLPQHCCYCDPQSSLLTYRCLGKTQQAHVALRWLFVKDNSLLRGCGVVSSLGLILYSKCGLGRISNPFIPCVSVLQYQNKQWHQQKICKAFSHLHLCKVTSDWFLHDY